MKKLLVVIMTLAALCDIASAQTKKITLDDIWTYATFRPSGISSIRSMNDGEHYCVLTRSGIEKYSYKTGEKESVVCAFSDPMHKKAKPLPPIESYQFSQDEQKILLSAEFEPIYRHSGVSSYYLYNVADGHIDCLTKEGKQRLTTFSPDGKMIAYVRDNNLFIMTLSSQKETQVTFDGQFNHIINGTTDWVYEEEFAITKGFYWSPDSKKIAFYRFDESKVKFKNGCAALENGTLIPRKAGEDSVTVSFRADGKTVKRTFSLYVAQDAAAAQ